VREWLHVEDCVTGAYAVLEKGRVGELYNMGSGQERRSIDVAMRILSILGKPVSLIEFVQDRPGHDFRYSVNSDKIKKDLGFEVKTGFNEGLEKTIQWYVANQWWWRS
jgi:dTDP-glucose 4,6-dehydratase